MWKPILILGALAVSTAPVNACASLIEPGEPPVEVRDEAAIIVWDAAHKEEHFIRRAEFGSAHKNFGFLVPTPTEPKLSEVDSAVFDPLYEVTKPKTVTKTRWIWHFDSIFLAGGRIKNTFNTAAGSINTSADGVSVLNEVRLADYDAAVLKSNDSFALRRWLEDHGYAANASFDAWLKPYAERGWVVTAFKVTKDSYDDTASLAPVRMSFKTETPFYPYSEPKGAKSAGNRSLRVFFFGQDRMQGAMAGNRASSWPGNVLWSDAVPGETLDATAKSLGLQPIDLECTPRMTVFRDGSSPRPGYADVNFATAADQSVVQPPPNIKWRERIIFIPAEGVVVLIFGTIWFRARRRGE